MFVVDLYTRPEPSKSKSINQLKQYFKACTDTKAMDALGTKEFREELEVRKILGFPAGNLLGVFNFFSVDKFYGPFLFAYDVWVQSEKVD
jgi:hypothetical protein